MQEKYYFTSESVTDGHPDKICDQIADTILDAALSQDLNSRMAVEASIKDDLIFVFGEANTKARLNYKKIARSVLKDIGYEERYKVIVKVGKQSSEISHAVADVDNKIVCGAGDQGIMFGYATNETNSYMPMPIFYAHQLAIGLHNLRRRCDFIKPDGKTQVTVEYVNGKPTRVDTIVVSTQHAAYATKVMVEHEVKQMILNVIPSDLLVDTKILINPSGSFVVGGSFGDSGTTGRKIVVDTYGGMGRIGGGSLSAKCPSKVDRTGAYYARWVAKNIVANGFADKCEIQVSYAIGINEPISIFIETFGTEKVNHETLQDLVNRYFNFNVNNMISQLDLLRPIYRPTATFGHFGRSYFPWETIIKMKLLEGQKWL